MLARLLNGLAGAAGAAGVSQGPAFLAQYQQQLAGRLAQVRADLAGVIAESAARGLDPREFVARAKDEGGEFGRVLAADAERALEALDRLQAAYDALAGATPLFRPLAFVEYLDPAVARATLTDFAPAMPLTVEGLVYAALGLLAALVLLAGCEKAGRAGVRAVKRSRRGNQHAERVLERREPRF